MLKMFNEEEQKKYGKNNDNDNNELGTLDLFDQPEMEQFFYKGIRGGQSFISTRHAKGNADPKSPGHHLLYVDGKSMTYIILLLLN